MRRRVRRYRYITLVCSIVFEFEASDFNKMEERRHTLTANANQTTVLIHGLRELGNKGEFIGIKFAFQSIQTTKHILVRMSKYGWSPMLNGGERKQKSNREIWHRDYESNDERQK